MVRGNDALNGFVDTGCTIRGELEFDNSFRLDGRVEGSVRSRSELVVGSEGVVEGEIDVARCLVGGQVRGTIRASEQVVLHSSAKVWADIHTTALIMEEGAHLEGRVNMESVGKKPAAGQQLTTKSPG